MKKLISDYSGVEIFKDSLAALRPIVFVFLLVGIPFAAILYAATDEKAAPIVLSESEVSQVAQARTLYVAAENEYNAALGAALDPASLDSAKASGVLGRLQAANARKIGANSNAQFIVMSAIARHKLDPDKIWNLSDDGKSLSEVKK